MESTDLSYLKSLDGPPDPLPSEEDDLSADSRLSLEEMRNEYQNKKLQQSLKETQENHELRKEYADKLFGLIVIWLIALAVMIGYLMEHHIHMINSSVLITIVTSTTTSILGLFVIAAKWLFKAPVEKAPTGHNN